MADIDIQERLRPLWNTANTIRGEETEGANTAIRVGGLLVDIVKELSSLNSSTEIINNYFNGKTDTSDVDSKLEELNNDLNESWNRELDEIKQMIDDIKKGKNFVNGWMAEWDEELKAYLISVGLLDKHGNKAWAYIETRLDSIEAAVNAYKPLVDENGNLILEEYFQSWFHNYIENDTVINELKSRYALTDSEQNVLKWLEAGLHQAVNANKAFSEVFAMSGDNEALQNAVARLKVQIEELNGQYKALANLTSKVSSAVNDKVFSMAGVITEATLGSALAEFFARDTTTGKDIIAKIVAKVENGIAEITVNADVIREIATEAYINMEKLVIGGDTANGTGAVLKTINKDGNMLGFEIAAGNFTIDENGNWTPTSKMVGRYRFGYYYFNAGKIVTHNIVFDTPTVNKVPGGDQFASMDMMYGSKIKWFYRTGGAHEADLENGGDQFGYSGNASETDSAYAAQKNNPSGWITFNSNDVLIKGNLVVSGTVQSVGAMSQTTNENFESRTFTLNNWMNDLDRGNGPGSDWYTYYQQNQQS